MDCEFSLNTDWKCSYFSFQGTSTALPGHRYPSLKKKKNLGQPTQQEYLRDGHDSVSKFHQVYCQVVLKVLLHDVKWLQEQPFP